MRFTSVKPLSYSLLVRVSAGQKAVNPQVTYYHHCVDSPAKHSLITGGGDCQRMQDTDRLVPFTAGITNGAAAGEHGDKGLSGEGRGGAW